MKKVLFLALMSIALTSCGDNGAEHSQTGTESSVSDTGTAPNVVSPEVSSSTDTGSVQGKGTDRIPSRTGTTGQGNTSVTGSATGSPTGTTKDTTK